MQTRQDKLGERQRVLGCMARVGARGGGGRRSCGRPRGAWRVKQTPSKPCPSPDIDALHSVQDSPSPQARPRPIQGFQTNPAPYPTSVTTKQRKNRGTREKNLKKTLQVPTAEERKRRIGSGSAKGGGKVRAKGEGWKGPERPCLHVRTYSTETPPALVRCTRPERNLHEMRI